MRTTARLVAGLSLLGGMEAMTVLRDVCHLDAEAALAVTDWAAPCVGERHAR
jgi:hypothetical protein